MRLIFAGTPDFAVAALDALHAAGHDIAAVFTQPDRPTGRGRRLQPSAVARRAEALQLPVYKAVRLDADAQAQLRALAPEALLVVAYGLLLPQAVLDIPPLGCLNVHASLLPRWRGAAPIARAIQAGDIETGVCIMRMDAGLDTGPVLARARHPLTAESTAATAHDALAALGAELLVKTLPAYARGDIKPEPQAAEGATYAKKLNKDEARLDWSQPADRLARQVRAFNPAPVAWTTLDNQRYRIWNAMADITHSDAEPGSVIRTDAKGVFIATGAGALRTLQLQRPGGRAVAAADAARGWNLLGRRFV